MAFHSLDWNSVRVYGGYNGRSHCKDAPYIKTMKKKNMKGIG